MLRAPSFPADFSHHNRSFIISGWIFCDCFAETGKIKENISILCLNAQVEVFYLSYVLADLLRDC